MDHVLLLSERPASGSSDLPIILTAIGAIAGPFIAAFAIAVQGRRIRRQLGLENMWRLVEKWDSTLFHRRRAVSAQYLLEHFGKVGGDDLPKPAIHLIDIFELLGFLVLESKTLSLRDAWVTFSYPAVYWWHVCRPAIKAFQKEDASLYEDYERLVAEFIKFEADEKGKTPQELQPSDEDLIAFLQGEVALGKELAEE